MSFFNLQNQGWQKTVYYTNRTVYGIFNDFCFFSDVTRGLRSDITLISTRYTSEIRLILFRIIVDYTQ